MKAADDYPDEAILKIVFDDSKTGSADIKKAMEKSGFPVSGDPELMK